MNDHCWKCGSDATPKDNFCRECGAEKPALFISFDWKEEPSIGQLNKLLAPFKCKIIELETNSDTCAISVRPLA